MVINYDPRLIDLAKQFDELAPEGCIADITVYHTEKGKHSTPSMTISVFPAGTSEYGYECTKSTKLPDNGVIVNLQNYEEKEEAAK